MFCACAERRGTGPPPQIRMAQKLAAQTVFAREVGFGAEVQPRPTQAIKQSPNFRRNKAHSFGVAYPLYHYSRRCKRESIFIVCGQLGS